METNKIFTEAHARIIWGESADSVRGYLIQNNIPQAVANDKIRSYLAERNAEVRKIGLRKVLIGSASLLVAGIFIYFLFRSYDPHSQHAHPLPTNAGKALGGALLAALYGLSKLIDGICDLVRPQSEDGSIPDLEE